MTVSIADQQSVDELLEEVKSLDRRRDDFTTTRKPSVQFADEQDEAG